MIRGFHVSTNSGDFEYVRRSKYHFEDGYVPRGQSFFDDVAFRPGHNTFAEVDFERNKYTEEEEDVDPKYEAVTSQMEDAMTWAQNEENMRGVMSEIRKRVSAAIQKPLYSDAFKMMPLESIIMSTKLPMRSQITALVDYMTGMDSVFLNARMVPSDQVVNGANVPFDIELDGRSDDIEIHFSGYLRYKLNSWRHEYVSAIVRASISFKAKTQFEIKPLDVSQDMRSVVSLTIPVHVGENGFLVETVVDIRVTEVICDSRNRVVCNPDTLNILKTKFQEVLNESNLHEKIAKMVDAELERRTTDILDILHVRRQIKGLNLDITVNVE